jgi:hypothetical protein
MRSIMDTLSIIRVPPVFIRWIRTSIRLWRCRVLSIAEALTLAQRVRREGQISQTALALVALLTELENIVGPEALSIMMGDSK